MTDLNAQLHYWNGAGAGKTFSHPVPLQRLRAAYVRRPPRHQRSSLTNSRANIGHHYDLSNDLFETFLETLADDSSNDDERSARVSVLLHRMVVAHTRIAMRFDNRLYAYWKEAIIRFSNIITPWNSLNYSKGFLFSFIIVLSACFLLKHSLRD